MAIQEIVVPDIGGAEGAEVIELLVAVGDEIEEEQGLIVLESDKASMEIPATCAGTIVELLVKEGDELSEGAPIAKVEVAGEATADSAEASGADDSGDAGEKEDAGGGSGSETEPGTEAEAQSKFASGPGTESGSPSGPGPEPDPEPGKEPEQASGAQEPAAGHREQSAAAPAAHAPADSPSGIYAGPAVRKLAREFGVPLADVPGSGPSGRILKEDLHRYVSESLAGEAAGAGIPEVPDVDFGRFGEVEVTQRSKLDKLTAANMHRSWLNVPHVTQFDEADITDLEAFRGNLKREAEQRGVRLTPVPFLLKACAVALRDNPRINAALARGGEDLVYRKYVHIGMAVDTPAGLVVPVIRDVDRKTIWELAAEVADAAERARERKLKPQDMQGGCFTVSSLGAIGGTGFTPVVNTPEVAILGVSRLAVKPVWNGSEFAPRKMLPVSLSYDHRVVNGGDGGRFLSQVVELLADIRRLSL